MPAAPRIICTPVAHGMVSLLRSTMQAAAKAALYSSVVSGVTAVLSFLLAPTIGALSDAFGRHPFFILTACTAAAPAVCFAMFALGYAPLWLYYLTNGINYSLPGFSMALAHVADVAPPEHRAAAVGLVIGAFSATFITGPSLSAVLPLEPTLWASIGCSAAAFVYVGRCRQYRYVCVCCGG